MSFIKKAAAWLIDQALCLLVSFLTGVRPNAANGFEFSPEGKVYYANHGSHGDFLLIWISLPGRWRMRTRPVAGSDYWLSSGIKHFIIQNVFDALLIERGGSDPHAGLEQMSEALRKGESLIIFPEGTRNVEDGKMLQPFKSGIYHLARKNPDARFIPVWINNISRVLPKGAFLPVPLLCDVRIGKELAWQEGEARKSFLQRTYNELLSLSSFENEK